MKHDENRDLQSVAKIAKIDFGSKSINCSKSAKIGIHMWGKIDYLTKYCGWHFIWNNSASVVTSVESSIEVKKAKKEFKLTHKNKKKE